MCLCVRVCVWGPPHRGGYGNETICVCVFIASEDVICAPDMLRARVFPDNGGTWQSEYKKNCKVARRMAGTSDDDEWWAKKTGEYVLTELKAELINCMEAYAKATGFRAPGSQMRKKKRRTGRAREDPANLSSGDEGAEEEEEEPGQSGDMGVDEFGEAILDGECGLHSPKGQVNIVEVVAQEVSILCLGKCIPKCKL